MGVQAQGMIGNDKAFGQGHIVLALLYLSIVKLFNFAAVKAHHVVVVLALIELVHRFATFKMVAAQQAGLLKLGQNPVHRGEANVGIVFEQMLEHIFCRHVTLRTLLEDFQNLLSGHSGF
jgi:hypothetical protein